MPKVIFFHSRFTLYYLSTFTNITTSSANVAGSTVMTYKTEGEIFTGKFMRFHSVIRSVICILYFYDK